MSLITYRPSSSWSAQMRNRGMPRSPASRRPSSRPDLAQPVSGSARVVVQRRMSTTAAVPCDTYAIWRSPVRRHGIRAWPLSQIRSSWLSSKVRNDVPDEGSSTPSRPAPSRGCRRRTPCPHRSRPSAATTARTAARCRTARRYPGCERSRKRGKRAPPGPSYRSFDRRTPVRPSKLARRWIPRPRGRETFSCSDRPGADHRRAGTLTRFRSCRTSAIWTALVAAPLSRLSETTHRHSPRSCEGSRRRRPTNTSSRPAELSAVG